jgi:predicted metal-dependent enzyme (double-stranded beta helix superfamily)
MGYDLATFVKDLRAVVREAGDDRTIIAEVSPLARELALARSWLAPRHYECDPGQGFGVHLLHEEPDHTLAVFAASWLPGRRAPPHNHGTWAVVAGADGAETNVFWERLDDGTRPGYAQIRKQAEQVFGPGDVVSLLAESIHSVENRTGSVTVSLHVYGRHLNHVARLQFDPLARTATPFRVVVQ